MQLRHYIAKAYDFLTCSLDSYTPEERDFIRLWIESEQHTYHKSMATVLMWVLMGANVAMYIRSPMPQRPIELVTYGTLLVIALLWRYLKVMHKINQRHIVAVFGSILLVGSAASANVAITATPPMASLVMVSSYFIANLVYLTVLFPYADIRILSILPINASLGYFAFMNLRDGGTVWDPFQLVIGYTAIACGILYSRIYRMRREILSEFRIRNQLLQNERLRIEVIEQQLSLANEIQDSLAPPQALATPFGASAKFYQKKFHPLGGDWMAVRTLNSGETIYAVADVTGKGVGAALVVHAVQSLWAQALTHPSFSVEAWIDSVNQALLVLGKNKPHTLTLGILVMTANTMTYHSAGHVPCYVITDSGDLHVLLGRGNLIGFSDDLELQTVCMELDFNQAYTVLLGTDGALGKGTRCRRRDLLRLTADIENLGANALEQNRSDDDKLLIRIDVPIGHGRPQVRQTG